MTNLGTYFYDTEGNRLASENGILPIPLFKGYDNYISLEFGRISRRGLEFPPRAPPRRGGPPHRPASRGGTERPGPFAAVAVCGA